MLDVDIVAARKGKNSTPMATGHTVCTHAYTAMLYVIYTVQPTSTGLALVTTSIIGYLLYL